MLMRQLSLKLTPDRSVCMSPGTLVFLRRRVKPKDSGNGKAAARVIS